MRRSNILKRFFLANMIVFSFSILILAAISVIDIVRLQNQMNQQNQQQVDKMVTDLELRLLEMHRVAESMRLFPGLRAHAIYNSLGVPHRITRELDKLRFPARHLNSVGVIYRQSLFDEVNFVIFTNRGVMTVGMYAMLQCAGGISEAELYEAIKNVTDVTFIFNFEPRGHRNFMLMAAPLENAIHPYSGILLFNIDMSILVHDIYTVRNPYDSLLITDNQGRVLFSSSTGGLDGNRRLFPRHIAFSSSSQRYGLEIQWIVDQSSFHSSLVRTLSIYALLAVFTILMGLAVSYKIANINYMPIRQLADKAGKMLDDESASHNNELNLIDKTLEDFLSQANQLREKIYKNETISNNQMLISLLNGKISDGIGNDSMSALLQQANDEALSFCVIIMLIDNYDDFVNNNSIRIQWGVKRKLCDLFESLASNMYKSYCTDIAIKDGVVGVIAFDSHTDSEPLLELCGKLRIEARKIPYLQTLTCAISPICDIDNINSSFEKTLANAQYRFFLGNDTTLTNELVQSVKNAKAYDIFQYTHLLEPLFVSIKEYNVDNISKVLDDLFALLGSSTSKSDYNSVYFKILSELEKIMNEIGLYSNDTYRLRLNMLYAHSFETLEQTRDSIFEFMLELSSAYNRFKASNLSKDLYANIISYIEHNYSDPNLSLSSIADALSFNPSYLTRFFKERNGVPLMQYVDNIRLEKARELLKASDYNIKQIVNLVGYTDEANFFRKFKKREGMPPSQFRSLYKTV